MAQENACGNKKAQGDADFFANLGNRTGVTKSVHAVETEQPPPAVAQQTQECSQPWQCRLHEWNLLPNSFAREVGP
jgi:hypothetical protein